LLCSVKIDSLKLAFVGPEHRFRPAAGGGACPARHALAAQPADPQMDGCALILAA
jgi:hypothetical protein